MGIDLNLFNNQIKGTIDFDIIGQRLCDIETLSLSYNQIENITNINKNTHWPSKLKLLDLSFNLIECDWNSLKWNELNIEESDEKHTIAIHLNDNKIYGVFEE